VIAFKKNGGYLVEAKQLGGSQSIPSGNKKGRGILPLAEEADDFSTPNDYRMQEPVRANRFSDP
jgi:hypothetical protein